ncbi:ABC transporter ATP-binding protein [Candidatus Woesebacteria bacterium]|nr:ABC transporter ATP-binding protein [Candidatus Woesebacteria bacterium]
MVKLLRFLKSSNLLLVLIVLLATGQTLANLYLPNLMSDIVNNGIAAFDTAYIWRTGGLMVLVAIAGTVFAVVGTFFSSRVTAKMSWLMRSEIFSRIQQFSLQEFDTISTASLITRTTNDTTQIQQVMVMMLNMLITAPLTLVLGVVLAIDQDAQLAWILVAIIPVLVTVILILLFKAIPLFAAMQIKLDKLNLILDENLIGVRVVRAFNRIRHEEARFNETNLEVTGIAIKVNQLIAIMMPTMMFLINISSVAIIWFGSKQVAGGHIQLGSMFAFLQYAIQILFSLLMVALLFIMIPRAEASAKRINEVLELDPEIKDAKKLQQPTQLRGTVEFDKVTFSYHNAESPALTNISFKTSPGKILAIIGGTGSGKSTLVNLIPRFYDVSSGRVLIDGVDVRDMTQAQLRAKIGFVPQKAVLFAGTINENIRYGKSDATEKEILHAAKVAQAHEFIKQMPEGFESSISQGGTNVSGGQMQRLSIARALVRKPEIYVFDDTFSALDFKTDAKLRAALRKEIKQSTVLIVAQRVSTVIDADQIVVLDEGKVVGIGIHHDLMKTCAVYKAIVSSQLSATEIEAEA